MKNNLKNNSIFKFIISALFIFNLSSFTNPNYNKGQDSLKVKEKELDKLKKDDTQITVNENGKPKELVVEIIDRDTRNGINGVTVYLYEMPSKKLIGTKTTEYGYVTFPINFDQVYEIRACKKFYTKGGMSIFDCHPDGKLLCIKGASNYNYETVNDTDNFKSRLRATISLDLMKEGKTFNLKNILYDLNKSALRPEGKTELNKIYSLMKQYSYMTIEISSHTDCRGSDNYNNTLSQKRADSCKRYLISRGINKKRIVSKGYGETKLLNKCADGVECDESLHQINRRTEMEILTLPMDNFKCEPGL